VNFSSRDAAFMALALRLAAKGRGRTHPNPMVGAVVVAKGRIVGQGWHRRAGGPHAEVPALRAAGRRARGATRYVTLEPCSHTDKRTPPCVPRIVASNVKRVVVAMRDPNPRVQGRGLSALRRAGISASVGCLQREAERLNEAYGHWMRTGRPFVVLKAAMTLDGKIATADGDSQWITGSAARRDAHRLRAEVDAVMVGAGTVLRDDPRLTVRMGARGPAQPWRVVLDSTLRLPLSARVLAGGRAIVATTTKAPPHRIERLRARGVTVLVLPLHNGRVSLRACLERLGGMGIGSVLLEGGSELNASALREGLVGRLVVYVAPVLMGGQDAKSLIGGASPKHLADALRIRDIRVRRAGSDLVIEGRPTPRGS
jgi:diaminohydroxyphosphoribosylaminopyrimidine deaminase/5-amino-6-(5-phosphoribosylamino)uracil reductase